MAGGGTLAAYAAASMRLHQQLALLLDDAEPPLGSPLVAQVWRDIARYGEIRGGMGRYREV